MHMDHVFETIAGLGAWRWLALAALLFAAEMATGTAYLLWLSAAAVATAIVVALPGETGIALELAAFGAFSIASTLVGRRFFKPGMTASDQPDLNNPEQRHLGARVVAVADFAGGEGRVSLGDTQWQAQTLDGSSPHLGAGLKVVSVAGTTLHVKVAD
jgi:inner membrane protein